MRVLSVVVFLMMNVSIVEAEIPDHHAHVGSSEVQFNYEFLEFKNSKQKEDGRRYGMTLDHQDTQHHFQLYMEHTDTKTKPVMPKDLSVNKYAFKYQYSMSKKETLSFIYMNIDDNLIAAVDGTNIYGLGYSYKSLSLMQYVSDYRDFNVYQSDVKWGMKKEFDTFTLKGAVMGKYIHLQDRLGNVYTQKTKQDYFTLGLKVHAEYEDWHIGAVGYVGERIFAVMNEGLRVQHHAMAFEKSYMFSVGRAFDDVFVNLRYIKQFATEVPIGNEDVEVSNIAVNVSYSF
ncbi:MAG: hypothetical protein GQ531_05295 [Sulfurovum sp.]|nr:hypothetical protein [Sulfurovum sp.]